MGRGHGDVRDVAAKRLAPGCGPSWVQAAERGVRRGSSPSSVGVRQGSLRARRRGSVLPVTQMGGESLQKGKLYFLEAR